MRARQKWRFATAALSWRLAAGLLFQQRLTAGQVVPVLCSDWLQSVVATGRLNAPPRIELDAQVSASVLAVQVCEGDHVKALNRATQQARVALALAVDSIRIDAGMDEKHLHMLTLGMPARTVVDAYPAQPFDAQLSCIGPAVDSQRGTVEVRLSVSVELIGGGLSVAGGEASSGCLDQRVVCPSGFW